MSRSPPSVDLMIAPARLPRRGLLALGLLGLAPFAWRPAHALGEGEAAQGLRAALERGAGVAVDTLGRDGGYLNNPLVRIALPEGLQQAWRPSRCVRPTRWAKARPPRACALRSNAARAWRSTRSAATAAT